MGHGFATMRPPPMARICHLPSLTHIYIIDLLLVYKQCRDSSFSTDGLTVFEIDVRVVL